MPSSLAQIAIRDALETGRVVLKFISPNDAGVTKSHQAGFHLPKNQWGLFSPHPPVKITDLDSDNPKSHVQVFWQNNLVTDSVVTWYGKHTRSEYRLTCFGKGFPFRGEKIVGSLLVLVAESHATFRAYVLDNDDDIEDVQTTLGCDIGADNSGLASEGTAGDKGRRFALVTTERHQENLFNSAQSVVKKRTAHSDVQACLSEQFSLYASGIDDYPKTNEMSRVTQEAVAHCVSDLMQKMYDERLRILVDAEFELFQIIEQRLDSGVLKEQFEVVGDWLKAAMKLMQRRKSRGGRSLEHQVEFLLEQAGITFDSQASGIDGKPDIIIPGEMQYHDESCPVERICMLGVKRTCKDRWRQILTEAPRLSKRHLLTLQPSISGNQLHDMAAAGVTLVVPKDLHKKGYPESSRNGIELLSVEQFIEYAQSLSVS
jgi:restriction endonuclease EcoRII-like protein